MLTLTRTCLGILAFFSCVASLHARIGEDAASIAGRYGEPTSAVQSFGNGLSQAEYSYNDFTITVVYLNGRSSYERYRKQNLKDFSDQEIQLLLKANGQGRGWVDTKAVDPNMRAWSCSGTDIFATYPKFSLVPALLVASERCRQRMIEQQNKQDQDKLERF